MGKVSLEGMEFYARHGYYEEERVIGNKYSVDVTLDVDFSEAASEKSTSNVTSIFQMQLLKISWKERSIMNRSMKLIFE